MINRYKTVLCTATQNIECMPTHPISSNYGQRKHYTASYAVLARQYSKILYPFEVIKHD